MKLQVACYSNPHISPTRTTTQGKQQTPLLSVCLKERVSFIESLCSNAGDSHQSKVQSWSFKDCLCDSEPWLQVPSWSKIQAKMEANTHGICSILGFRYIPLSGFFPRFMIVPFTYIRSPKLRPLQDLKSLPQFQALAPLPSSSTPAKKSGLDCNARPSEHPSPCSWGHMVHWRQWLYPGWDPGFQVFNYHLYVSH